MSSIIKINESRLYTTSLPDGMIYEKKSRRLKWWEEALTLTATFPKMTILNCFYIVIAYRDRRFCVLQLRFWLRISTAVIHLECSNSGKSIYLYSLISISKLISSYFCGKHKCQNEIVKKNKLYHKKMLNCVIHPDIKFRTIYIVQKRYNRFIWM